MHTCICKFTGIYICTHTYTNTHSHEYVYIYIYVCMYVCIYICMYVCMYVHIVITMINPKQLHPIMWLITPCGPVTKTVSSWDFMMLSQAGSLLEGFQTGSEVIPARAGSLAHTFRGSAGFRDIPLPRGVTSQHHYQIPSFRVLSMKLLYLNFSPPALHHTMVPILLLYFNFPSPALHHTMVCTKLLYWNFSPPPWFYGFPMSWWYPK